MAASLLQTSPEVGFYPRLRTHAILADGRVREPIVEVKSEELGILKRSVAVKHQRVEEWKLAEMGSNQ